MGDKRIPDEVHKAKGTFRKDRHSKAEIKSIVKLPKSKYPKAPEYLDEMAVKVWDRIRMVMEETGLYSEADADLIAGYCILQSQFQQDQEDFPSNKLAQLRLTRNDLYLSPETRIKLGAVESEEDSEYGDF